MPKISICSPAKNTHLWENLWKSIEGCDIDYEIIFVGPNYPSFQLPQNVHFIHSNVKPAQCLEIAVRQSTGDFIIHMADDCEFKTKKALDILYEQYLSYNDEKIGVSSRFMLNGVDQSHYAHKLKIGQTWLDDSIVMPCFMLMSKKFYLALGGADVNFLAVCFDMDIVMRIYEAGGRVVLSGVYGNENKPEGTTTFHDHVWINDREYFDNMWSVGTIPQLVRTKPVESYPDPISLKVSYGRKYTWP